MRASVEAGHCKCIYCLISALLKQKTVPYSCSLLHPHLSVKKKKRILTFIFFFPLYFSFLSHFAGMFAWDNVQSYGQVGNIKVAWEAR